MHLVGRYLGGFGPATAGDIATFCGIPTKMLKSTLDNMELREFRDETGATLLDLPDAVLPPADTPAPVRFLPTWDAILLVHAGRTAVLAERHRPILFNSKVPPSLATFMVDGAVAGIWRWDAKADRVVLDPFEPLPKRVTAELEEEAAGLAELHR